MTQREVEIVIGMVLGGSSCYRTSGPPARELLAVWVIVALSLALWRILIGGNNDSPHRTGIR